jgi:hypothetical protein
LALSDLSTAIRGLCDELDVEPVTRVNDTVRRASYREAMDKEVSMYKLVTLVALIALAIPATALGQKSHQRSRAVVRCSEEAVFLPGRDYAICGGRFWVRMVQSRKIVAVPFWRLQQGNDPNRP